MAIKHVFIGLGGSGVNTLTPLKYKIYERTQATEMKTRRQVMESNCRFIFVDTDSRDIQRANEQYKDLYENGKINFINDNELLNLGDINPYISYQEAKNSPDIKINSRILESCSQMVAESMENRDLSFGAGALRMKSRIAFGRKKKDFIDKLKGAIDALNPVENNTQKNVIRYWIVASCNGGTGGGTLLDVLYQVNMIHRTYIEPGNPNVGLILYMPRAFMNVNVENDRYPRNAYAMFSELEAFQKWSKDESRNKLFHRMAMADDHDIYNENMGFRPFEFCIPIDYHTENFNNMGSMEKMYYNTAELLYYIHDGEGANGFKSFLDNNEDGDLINNPEFFLIPMGYMALRKPNEQFENYVALRSRFEVLKYGIIGSAIDSADERKKLMMQLFDSEIKSVLFEKGVGKASYYNTISTMADDMINEELPENLIRDNENKIVNTLPSNISNGSAEDVINTIKAAIDRYSGEKKNTCSAIEKALWTWTENNSRKWGLLYVLDILQELDAYCTDIYMAYTTDTNTALLQGLLRGTRKSLTDNRDTIENELDDLYQKACELTLKERITKGNAKEISDYFERLKDWVNASVNVELAEDAFDIIKDLTYGDNGIIDRIISHVRRLVGEANAMLNGTEGVNEAYKKLAKSFYTSKLDVTSVYLPDITEFADGNGWREDGNLFSQWYSLIIGRTNDFVTGEGFRPLRNEDSATSIESVFSNMLDYHKEEMIQKKYVVDEESRLFTNTTISDYKRMIEDLLDYAADTVKILTHGNKTVGEQWYNKTLAQFFTELNNEATHAIQRKAQPALFFPYSKAKVISRITEKYFFVGPSGIADKVFLESESSNKIKAIDSNDPSVMYKIVTKLGMSFAYYDLYNNVKNEYDKCMNKEFYHFHQAFANAGADADNIKLPREITPEQTAFAKYLILNQLKGVFSDIMVKGTETYNANHYSDTPVIFDGMIAKFANSSAIKMIRNEMIELQVTDGDSVYYTTLNVDDPKYKMTELLEKFTEKFTQGRFGVLAAELIRDIEFLASDALRQQYQAEVKKLKEQLNADWANADRQEKNTISHILRIIDERLSKVSDFLSKK